jgi:peptidoglycan/xylan/chitin deacetylase (PgdA/CDA1 family)
MKDSALKSHEYSLKRGVFTLSLDFELIWGTLDLFGPEGFRSACELEREVIIDRLLALLAEFEIPATWCIVGHLFLDRCDGKHRDIVRPNHSWFPQDWFVHDPGSDVAHAPIFYGRDLIEKIRACPAPQEIGSHSFSHVIFSDEGCSRATAESELAASVRVAREMGIELRSFVFPRNEVGHLDLLREYGFKCYRGPEPHWYERGAWPGPVKRLAHLWDVIAAKKPPTVLPERAAAGLWNIPGSMIYFPMHGVRGYIPVGRRIRRAVKGLEAAARERRIFHLWFHPTNLADKLEEMFRGLRVICERASELRRAGRIDFLPMSAIGEIARAAGESA